MAEPRAVKRNTRGAQSRSAEEDGPLQGPTPGRIDPLYPDLDGRIVEAFAKKLEVATPRAFGARQRKLYVWFELTTNSPYPGAIVWLAMNYAQRPGPSSKYYRSWSIANEGRPRRRERMTPRRFQGSIFEIKCRTVTKHYGGEDHPEVMRYTIADEIVDLVARGTKSR